MAIPSPELISALFETAERLNAGVDYSWSHQGRCNCGHLAQTITRRTPAEIHRMALQKAGDWEHHIVEYCPHSGFPVDQIIDEMLAVGFTLDDIAHLERLSDPQVLRTLPADLRNLDFRQRKDVVLYLRTWAKMLVDQWVLAHPHLPLPAPTRVLAAEVY